MKKSLYLIMFALLLVPGVTLAHVKWFIMEGARIETPKEDMVPFAFIAIFISAVIILLGILIEKHLPGISKNTQYWLNSKKHKIASLFSVAIGAFLLLSAYAGFIFAPNLSNTGILHAPFLIIETLLGLMFLIGFGVRIASILLLATYFLLIFYAGPLEIIESLIIAGSAIFMLIYGRSHYSLGRQRTFVNRFFATQEEYAIPLLRVFVGIDLFILGFSEKILRPDLALSFLEHHPWNFMQILGLEWYSDLMFVMSAGVAEALLGLIFILGIVTRINALAIGVFFTITLILLGPIELLGHAPHFAFVVIMLIFGSGERLKLSLR